MSNTPYTDRRAYGFTDEDGIRCDAVHSDFARRLERERDHALALVAEMKQAIIWAKAEAKERLHRLDQAACERRTWLEAHEKMKRDRNEANAQMCQAIGYLSTIAEDCEAWLNNQCDETACEFIKAVRDYARKAVNQ